MTTVCTDWTTPTLHGRHVRLAPLLRGHADALRAAAADGELWTLRYTSVPGPAAGEAEAYIDVALTQRDAVAASPFAVFDAHGDLVGSTRFYDIDRAVPRVKIGYTWYARRAQRTGLNTEAKRLLLGHAFGAWRCMAVGLETSHENLTSQAAIERLGAKRDGVLRAHMRHRDGSLRDTVAYSILCSEWPAIEDELARKSEAHA
ncbi:MAG: N-acetyltransferase [Lysobacteraceae bacterium]|nr:MAG: N-acetyltransferase [Xanthomonadaceae bacterium]